MKKTLGRLVLFVLLMTAATALAECNHDFYMANTAKPTCESDGYYILKCNLCGYTKKEITDKAPGHNWVRTDSREATCAEAGYKKYECSNCGEKKTETIPELDHKWVDDHVLEEATCTKNGSKLVYCSVCHLTKSVTISKGHKYGSWTIIEEATDHTKGTRTRTCKRCSKKQTEEFYPDGTLYKDIKNKSAEVKHLQQMLTDLDFLNDKVDGKFGKKTEAAVKAFQKEYGLTADGIAWPQTIHTLGVAWDVEFGIPEDAYAPCCSFLETDENGKQYWETCEVHSNIYMHAADGLPKDADKAEIANAYMAAWTADLERMYQIWMLNCPAEEQPMVINHKTMFQGYLNSQQTLWNTQFGEGSLTVLERVNEMLENQCYTLCEVTYSLMVQE